MKTLGRRLSALEGVGSPGLWYLTDDEVRDRMVLVLETLESGGVDLPDGWRDLDDFRPIAECAREQVETML